MSDHYIDRTIGLLEEERFELGIMIETLRKLKGRQGSQAMLEHACREARMDSAPPAVPQNIPADNGHVSNLSMLSKLTEPFSASDYRQARKCTRTAANSYIYEMKKKGFVERVPDNHGHYLRTDKFPIKP